MKCGSTSGWIVIGHAAIAPRSDRTGRHVAEAHAALLAALGDERRSPGLARRRSEAREEDAVRRELQQLRVQLADERALGDGEFRAGRTGVVGRIGDVFRRARIDDAVGEADLGIAHDHQRPGDATLERDLGERMLDDQARRTRRYRSAVGIQREAGHQRAVAQHELARLVVGRCREAQRAAAEDKAVEHQTAARADGERHIGGSRDQRPRRVARGDHHFEPGRAGRDHIVDLEYRRLRIGEAVLDRQASAAGDGIELAAARRRRQRRCAVSQVRRPRASARTRRRRSRATEP